jgi:hypothetical protein
MVVNMVKVVINRCYGGFGLSSKAVLELVKMKSKAVKEETVEKYCGNGAISTILIPFEDGFFIEDRAFGCGVLYKDGMVYFMDDFHYKDTRTNPDLVKVVESLRNEADGMCAKLKIADVPDDVEWTIEEYDGIETVEEVHRTW